MNTYDAPREQIPLSFKFPYACVWFICPNGYIDGYFIDYYSFMPLDEAAFKSKIPFNRKWTVLRVTQ